MKSACVRRIAKSSPPLLAMVAGLICVPVCAQTDLSLAPEADNSQPSALAEVVVTGTHITTSGYQAPTPVTSASVEDLTKAAPTDIADALNKLPQFVGSSSPGTGSGTFANTPNHGNLLNLRGLGPIRTLVLLDGVRLPPTNYQGTVDVDILPQLLVKRVDVVTAGASSAYGSDAVAGVVNYVLDTQFSGVKATVQRGISWQNDDGGYRASLAGGTRFAERFHALVGLDYYQNSGYLQQDRPYLDNQAQAVGSVVGTAAPAGTAANPLIFEPGLRYNLATFGGLATSGPFADTNFVAPGQYRPAIHGAPTGTTGFYQGGDYYYGPGFQSATAGLRNATGLGRLSYDVTDEITAHLQTIVAQSKLNYQGLPDLVLAQPIYSGNAFLPAALQAQLTASGTPFFKLNKEMSEMGPLVTNERLTNYDIFAGIDGTHGRLKWSVNYTHGDSQHDVAQGNLLEYTKFAAAIDAVADPATGNIVCRPTLDPNPTISARYAGCVPFDLFGLGASSAAAQRYVTGTSTYHAHNVMNDVTATVSADVASLPAGAVSAAAGVEYRNQSLLVTSNSNPALPVDITGLRGLAPTTTRFYLTNVGASSGQENVKEAFVELAVPVLKNVPLAQSFDLNGAVRFTDYSTSGRVTTWKGGLTWAPIDDLRFRLTRSRDIRAPTLYDLFAGSQSTVGAGFDPQTNLNGTFPERLSGNSHLQPEIGNTLSTGVVFQPTFAPGFALSVDYYQVHITDAIASLTAPQILLDCYQSGGTSPECALIKRASPTTYPYEVDLAGVNVAAIKTRGIDVEGSYSRTLGPGRLTTRLYATYVDQFLTQLATTLPFLEYAGRDAVGAGGVAVVPRLKATGNIQYDIGRVGLFIQEEMIGSMKYNPQLIYAAPTIPPVFYTDATLTYRWQAHGAQVEAFTTVNNLFDKRAPLVNGTTAPGIGLSTIVGLYDTTGRYFNLGVRVAF